MTAELQIKADQLVQDLIASQPYLIGVEDCEPDDDGALQYRTESDHVIQVWEARPGVLEFSIHD